MNEVLAIAAQLPLAKFGSKAVRPRPILRKLIVLIAAGCCNHAAHAVLLGDFTRDPLPGTTEVAEPQLAGVIVEDITTPYSYEVEVCRAGEACFMEVSRGAVQSRVVKSVDGSYAFYWAVHHDGDVGVNNFQLSSFPTSPSYNANWRSDLPGDTPPLSVDGRSPNVVFWTWRDNNQFGGPGAVRPGESSKFFFLDTGATAYNKSAFYSLNQFGGRPNPSFTGASDLFATFAPVPEPQTYALLVAGMLTVAAFARRRTRR